MADPPRSRDTGTKSDRKSPTSIPRWLKVGAMVVIMMGLMFVVMLVLGGGSGSLGHDAPTGGH